MRANEKHRVKTKERGPTLENRCLRKFFPWTAL